MEDIPEESFRIVGILCYLNYPKYLKNIDIKHVEDIFYKIEEKIDEISIQIDELENYYKLIKDNNDQIVVLDKIKDKKTQVTELKSQLKFMKN